MEKGLRIPQNERTKTTNSLLISLMNQLEKVLSHPYFSLLFSLFFKVCFLLFFLLNFQVLKSGFLFFSINKFWVVKLYSTGF